MNSPPSLLHLTPSHTHTQLTNAAGHVVKRLNKQRPVATKPPLFPSFPLPTCQWPTTNQKLRHGGSKTKSKVTCLIFGCPARQTLVKIALAWPGRELTVCGSQEAQSRAETENHRQRRLGSSPRQDNSCTAKRGMQGLLNSAGKGGGGGVGGDNANDGRFEMQIASRVYSGRDPFTFPRPLSLSLCNQLQPQALKSSNFCTVR